MADQSHLEAMREAIKGDIERARARRPSIFERPAPPPVEIREAARQVPVPKPAPAAVEADPEPVEADPEPVAVEPEPVAVEPEPVPVEPEPVPVVPEPVEAVPEPVAVEPEPVAVEPEPEPEPAVEVSRPGLLSRLAFWRR